MPLGVRAICFDLFNTLVNVGSVPVEVGSITADILGVDKNRWREACFGPHHDICGYSDAYENLLRMAHSLDPTIPLARIKQAVTARQRRFDYALMNVDNAVIAGLQQLRQRGLKLALISNASTAEVSAWPASPLAAFFDSAVFSCECGSQKPQAQIYHHALTNLGMAATDCLFVGDGSSNEHQGAYAVGMRSVLLTHHLDEQEHLKRRNQYQGMLSAELASLHELDAWLLDQ